MRKKILLFISIAIFTMLILFGIEHFSSLNKKTQEISSSETQPTENTKDTELVIDIPKKEDITINMSVIGDIMCHNSQYQDAFNGSTYDFSYVFSDIKDYISNADIAIGNLERGYSNYPTFNTPEQLAYNLKDFGIDVVSTANNHCMDTGYKGLVSTLNYLDDAGISHTGTSRSSEEQNTVLIKDVNGIKIAFLSFTYGTNGIPVPSDKGYSVNLIDKDLIKKQLNLAISQNPDLICVSMHWGVEYQTIPNAEQKELADFLFNNGADIIIGNHPHVLQNFEKREIFEGCMPVEVMAKRGVDTLRYGPLKPVGFDDPRTGKRPYAVIQLRQDNELGTIYNIVGFQTNLKYGEQKRVFGMIPGLQNAEFVKYGVMHRNTYINSTKLLDNTYNFKDNKNIYFAGQITGVEGYVESISSGMVSALNAVAQIKNESRVEFSNLTMIGALAKYISTANDKFQPMNANFGIVPELPKRIKDKKIKYGMLADRAIENLKID